MRLLNENVPFELNFPKNQPNGLQQFNVHPRSSTKFHLPTFVKFVKWSTKQDFIAFQRCFAIKNTLYDDSMNELILERKIKYI